MKYLGVALLCIFFSLLKGSPPFIFWGIVFIAYIVWDMNQTWKRNRKKGEFDRETSYDNVKKEDKILEERGLSAAECLMDVRLFVEKVGEKIESNLALREKLLNSLSEEEIASIKEQIKQSDIEISKMAKDARIGMEVVENYKGYRLGYDDMVINKLLYGNKVVHIHHTIPELRERYDKVYNGVYMDYLMAKD